MYRRYWLWILVLALPFVIVPAIVVWLRHRAPVPASVRTELPRGDGTSVPVVDPDNPCGAVSAVLVSHLLHRPISLAEARQAVPSDSAGRTSAAALICGLRTLGFNTVAVRLSPQQLSQFDIPLIVFVRGSHFAVVVPTGGQNVWFLDPPRDPLWISLSELRSQWTGDAILVAGDEEASARNLRRIGLAP